MRSLAAVVCSLSLALAAPCQGWLAFPSGIQPGAPTGFHYSGHPTALAVMAIALSPGTTVVVLGAGLQCKLAIDPLFVAVPLGITDQDGKLAGWVVPPSHWSLALQVVELSLPPAAPQLRVSNPVHYVFQGCWGGGATCGG